ncbi:MAG: chromosome segregation protein SMC [Ignavibacteria bacterium]|nr:chromosome segregation protein SMC [Ignavibacteria bacterium]
MYLSKLEMVGFKSFGLKTDLEFTDGVTAIVGPNGCGKTNVVDAIRWVLGEQKTSMLRADSMDQVIFNGSRARKPLGMAEVSLTIENNKQILPTEYSQVVITRRLFRNGESQYLLNKTQCRLRDIVDLFMDTGMRSDAYSVIELKMIETILSDKADERRHLFEEAAGVTKYKARRKEAQRKLDAAQRDIARVQDIVREVQKTVNSLARQAEKARQHQDLSTRLRDLDRILFAFEYAEEFIALTQLLERITGIRQKREAAEAALTSAEQQVIVAEKTHEQMEQELRTAITFENDVRTALSEVQQRISLVDERKASAQRALERLDREQNESQSQQSSTSQELQQVRDRMVSGKLEHEEAVKELEAQRALVEEAQATLVQMREEMHGQREGLTAARQILNEQRNQADRYRIQGEGQQRRLAENEAQQRQASERLAQVEDQIARESADLPALDQQLAESEQRLHTAEARQRDLQTEQEGLQKDSEDLRSKLGHSSASLEFLVGLVDTTESSKFLLNTPEWTPSGEKLTLAEVINTGEELRVAIEAALGDAARYFVVAHRTEAQQAISALSKNSVGKATFLCRDAIPAIEQPPSLGNIDGVIGWASELVQADEQLRGAVRGILGHTVVVRSMDDAWKAMSQTPATSAVTLSGEIVHRAGAVRGGSTSKTEGVRVGRRERIDQLRGEIATLEQRIADVDGRLRAVKQELGTIDLRRLGDEVRKVAIIRNDRQQRLDSLRGRVDDVHAQQQHLHEEAQRIAGELESLRVDASAAEHAITEASEGVAKLESELASATEALQNVEQLVNQRIGEMRGVEIRVVRLSGELQTLVSNEGRLTNQSLTIDQRREQRDTERNDLQQQIATFETERTESDTSASTIVARLAEARSKREGLELSVREHSAAFHQAGEDVRRQRKELDGIVNEQHEADLKHNEVRLRMESLARRASEELDLEVPENPQMPESEVAPEELRTQVQDLRRKLTSMGNVNFLALEEHERENERFLFLTQQLSDLTESERALNETIAEINLTAREKFTSTFVRIRENFSTLFKMLFSEDDEADLQMIESADNDPLECTIEITAKPRGKRPHSIEMLSGGEKTLTAIALLFAIYLVKPSPFCILDEVDAPLDDANIDRYLKIIRKFAENTQFLMITHNKKTMEAADTLYGVTMEEPAVSKVVSVHLAGKSAA